MSWLLAADSLFILCSLQRTFSSLLPGQSRVRGHFHANHAVLNQQPLDITPRCSARLVLALRRDPDAFRYSLLLNFKRDYPYRYVPSETRLPLDIQYPQN